MKKRECKYPEMKNTSDKQEDKGICASPDVNEIPISGEMAAGGMA